MYFWSNARVLKNNARVLFQKFFSFKPSKWQLQFKLETESAGCWLLIMKSRENRYCWFARIRNWTWWFAWNPNWNYRKWRGEFLIKSICEFLIKSISVLVSGFEWKGVQVFGVGLVLFTSYLESKSIFKNHIEFSMIWFNEFLIVFWHCHETWFLNISCPFSNKFIETTWLSI